jgi:hypothetical protein
MPPKPLEDIARVAGPAIVRRPDPLETLLSDLGPQIHRGVRLNDAPLAHHPTGLAAIDELLLGGFPAGRLSEISGPPSSGRTSLALALLAHTTAVRGEMVATVDPGDAFEPRAAVAAGVDLERVLWVRAGDPLEALRCTERLMETGGIPLIMLDLCPPSPAAMPTQRRRSRLRTRPGSAGAQRRAEGGPSNASRSAVHTPPGLTHWIRLARLAAATQTGLLVLSSQRVTGSQSELTLETHNERTCFSDPPFLLEELRTRVVLARHRSAPAERSAWLQLRTDASAP